MGEREHGSGEVIMFPLTPDQRIPETLETLFQQLERYRGPLGEVQSPFQKEGISGRDQVPPLQNIYHQELCVLPLRAVS